MLYLEPDLRCRPVCHECGTPADTVHSKGHRRSRYLLLSNQKNLKDSQKIRLQEVLELNKRLSSVYVLKDYLKTIYQYHRRGWAKKTLNQWCQLAAEIDHPQVRRFIGRPAVLRVRDSEPLQLRHQHRPPGGGQQQDQSDQTQSLWLPRSSLLRPQSQTGPPRLYTYHVFGMRTLFPNSWNSCNSWTNYLCLPAHSAIARASATSGGSGNFDR